MEHDFPAIGRKMMMLNARRFVSVDGQPNMIIRGGPVPFVAFS